MLLQLTGAMGAGNTFDHKNTPLMESGEFSQREFSQRLASHVTYNNTNFINKLGHFIIYSIAFQFNKSYHIRI